VLIELSQNLSKNKHDVAAGLLSCCKKRDRRFIYSSSW